MQEKTKIDLLPDDNDVAPISALVFQTRTLGNVLWECCKSQAAEEGVGQESFKDSMDAEALSSGWGALVDAIVFFIRHKSPKMAEAIREAIEAEMRVVEAGADQMLTALRSQETQDALTRAASEIGTQAQAELTKGLAGFAGSLGEL